MRGKDYNTGLRGVLFEACHYERMGAAIWLYGWLVLRQTRQQGSTGWVLGGAPISYREIEEETGFNRRTLERWMQILRRAGYIEVDVAPSGVSVRISKAKKFRRVPQPGRTNAEGGRKVAERGPLNCVASPCNLLERQAVPPGIGSSSVERYREEKTREIHRDFHRQSTKSDPHQENKSLSFLDKTNNPKKNPYRENPTYNAQRQDQSGQDYEQRPEQQISPRLFMAEARRRLQLWRIERDEALQRELRAGAGPEVNQG
jgi:hypothetical protein